MYFPIADVTVSPVLLMSVGFLVGILGGFFGVGITTRRLISPSVALAMIFPIITGG